MNGANPVKTTSRIGPTHWARPLRVARGATVGRRRAGGAVLLEVILALVLFVAAAAIVTAGINASLDSVERQHRRAHAADLAITVMSELQMGLRSASLSGPTDFEPPFDEWTWEAQLSASEVGGGEAPALTSVEVIIRHKQSPVVHRLAQTIRMAQSQGERKESNAAGGF
jgi:hypothetical protein